jgi:hypothetical protein
LKLLFSFLLLSIISIQSFSQEIKLDYNDLPLNEVLLDLSARHNIQVSINAKTSAACRITLIQNFKTISKALEFLAKSCELEIAKVGEVYSFIEQKELPIEKVKAVYYQYQGEISDSESQESLPYAKIKVGNTGVIADENGRFSVRSLNPTEKIQIRYLGYHILDSTLSKNHNIKIGLKAQNLQLKAVIVDTSNRIYLSQVGDEPGKTKFNDISTSLVPGGNNNWMFNYMRLYPGIMAAGESVSDYIIWGSYSGQNHIIYDGITLFNSISVSNEIGRVNPSIVKSLDVYKGGYNVDIGDRTGGVLLIHGKDGNKKKVAGNISLNNQIANIYMNIPLFKNTSSLQFSVRKSYQLLKFEQKKNSQEGFVSPEFAFTDFNLKFSTKFKNNDLLQISSVASRDEYSTSFEKKDSKDYSANLLSGSDQIGTSLKYTHSTKKRGISTFSLSHSNYQSFRLNEASLKDSLAMQENIFINVDWKNNINEYSARLHHSFNTFKKNSVELNLAYIRNESDFTLNKSFGSFSNSQISLDRISAFAKDRIQIGKGFNVDLGVKIDLPFNSLQPYVQPRVNGTLNLTDKVNFTFGWGLYNQFASKTTITDSIGTTSSIWEVTGNNESPVQSAMHNVLGFSYNGKKIEMGVDGYAKIIDGLARYYSNSDTTTLSIGSAIAIGADVFIKFRFKKHEFWSSYSIGKVEETFNYEGLTKVELAPQNQLHEIKAAGVFNFHPFYFSLASVIGSGIESNFINSEFNYTRPYMRTDIAFQYKFKTQKLNFETGFSIVNLFNNRNARISQFTSFPDGTIASIRATHFTPSIFFNMKF